MSCLLLFAACKKEDSDAPNDNCLQFGPGEEEAILDALFSLTDGACVSLKEGYYKFENVSISGVKNVTFKGAGMDKTILDFSGQISGGEGVNVFDVTDFTIRDMKLIESEGDLLKVRNGTNVNMINVATVWSSETDSTTGAYAIYPVLCKNVLIDGCYAQGASDAGIYVGQTQGVIVRNSEAFGNVAGCEIENTTNAEVYDNEFHGNTGGLLIFDFPGLSQRGGNIKAYNNHIHSNNTKNFAPSASFGTPTGVGNCPPGTGVLILAASDIEIYNNRIMNNNTVSVLMVSGVVTDENAINQIGPNYYPFPTNVSVYDNTMSKGYRIPGVTAYHSLGRLLVAMHNLLKISDPFNNPRLQHIVVDGVNSNFMTGGTAPNPDNLCIRETEEVLFLNVDYLNALTPTWKPTTNVNPYLCP